MTTRRKVKNILFKSVIYLASAITVLILALILFDILSKGLGHITWKFLTSQFNDYKMQYGVLPMIIGTLYLVFLTLIIATPIGILNAIYLSEYAKPGKILNFIKFSIECLAGIPSIIYGLFGMILFVTVLGRFTHGYSILSGALTLSIMVPPTIIRTTEESLRAVPTAYKEGSLALGASRVRTIFKVVLPSAIPGIITSVILSIGRIVGESAAVIYTVGSVADMPTSIFSPSRTLTVQLYQLSRETPVFLDKTVSATDLRYATAALLIIIILILDLAATFIGKKLNKKNIGG
jgi:phosphate transport system permease protein